VPSVPPAAQAARLPGDPEPDVTSLLVTHRAIRRDLARLTAALAPDADAHLRPADRRALCRYGAALFAEISRHFDDEDGLLWPLIAATAGQCIDLAPLTDDHQAIAAPLGRAARALTGSLSAQAAEPVRELGDMIDEHIGDEEARILPAMRRYLPAGAYRAYETASWREAPPASLRFRAPWLARVAAPTELAALLDPGGWRARMLLASGRRGYARLERHAFGPR
jgi:hypothetical protein